ncbi:MAG TPA: nicotinate-nucleotide--dimethylbenzimidazole phosphoribosyltransferase [Steroidobacteraceae bacterium]|nr:nicotinate-nucleotide--dimethylbenzimidazole phosphoribosyltransferase [Steroidobacteraceae bacterium]
MKDNPHPMQMPAPDARAESGARARQLELTKPPGSLGFLEELACWFAARLQSPVPDMPACEIFVFAADHGVAARGVSAFPSAVTAQMLGNFAAGGAAINVLASLENCRIEVVDVGVAGDAVLPASIRRERIRAGTRDLSVEAAMSDAELAAALSAGERCAREAIRRGARLLIAGDMGIANTTAAACLICAFTGASPEQVVGRGTGVDDAGLSRKKKVVAEALARARTQTAEEPAHSAWLTLAQLGGLEIAAMAGFYIEAARGAVPVLLDGYISGAAALAAVRLEPGALRWMLASHRSAEAGHSLALGALGLTPMLDLGLRLGEGSGAALTLPIIRAALALHRDMATFAEAGVAGAGPPA